jgi:TPR repeat protein
MLSLLPKHAKSSVSHYAKLLRATMTALLVAVAGAAVAGPFEDAIAAYRRGDFATVEDANAAYRRGDYATAYRLYRPLAEGWVDAQFYMGLMYDLGQGVPQDYTEAMKWYRKAADQGYATAQHNLGILYDFGRGVRQDYAEAPEVVSQGCRSGVR